MALMESAEGGVVRPSIDVYVGGHCKADNQAVP